MLRKNNIIIVLGLILLLISGIAYFVDRGTSDKALLADVALDIQTDFQSLIARVESDGELLILNWKAEALHIPDDPEVYRVLFNPDSSIASWSSTETLPSGRDFPKLLSFPNREVLKIKDKQKDKLFFVIRHEHQDFVMISLIPLQIKYDVRNDYLPSFVYLGKYSRFPELKKHASDFRIVRSEAPAGMSINDKNGNALFSILVKDPSVFRIPAKKAVIFLCMAGLLVLLLGIYIWISSNYSRKLGGVVALGLFLGLRMLFLFLGFPQKFVSTDIFSPTALAINSANPSLGDFSLNVLFWFLALYFVVRVSFGKLSRLYVKILENKGMSWIFYALSLGISVFLVSIYQNLFSTIIRNSSVYFEFTNIFKLDIYSLILFLDVAGILACLLILSLPVLRFAVCHIKRHVPAFGWPLTIALILGISALVFYGNWPLVFAGITAPIMTLILLRKLDRWTLFQSDFLSFLLIILTLTLMTTISIVSGNEWKKIQELDRIANRVSEERDLVTESLFGRVLSKIEDESLVLQYGIYQEGILDNISKWLKDNFFERDFKGYEVNIYVYDTAGVNISRTSESKSLIKHEASAPGEVGEETLSENLSWLPYYSGKYDYLYLGLFKLFVRDLGELMIHVELLPTRRDVGQLYPQLLLDKKVQDKLKTSKDFGFAVYRGGKLSRKSPADPFPENFQGPKDIKTDEFRAEKEGEIWSMYYRPTDDKYVVARTSGVSLYDGINIFSFTFYFYIVAFLLLFIPYWIVSFFTSGAKFWQLSLRGKIQIFLLMITLVPLLLVIFFLSPLIKKRFEKDVATELLTETNRIASLLREDYLKLPKTERLVFGGKRSFKERLDELEGEIYKDINVYDEHGMIQFTTQPGIQEMGLTSGMMNPEVYHRIQSGEVTELVVEERIGKLSYFSGYFPIRGDDYRIRAYLNIPYLTQQDTLNEQRLSLLAFLVDIYVLIMLLIGFLGIILSNSITRPLILLQQKLEATGFGKTNDPIKWDSNDEIGEIISAYNKMLEKLADSEDKLAQSQRQEAWKEMARQVAHEIKNPLTPMRLSLQHLSRSWKDKSPNLDTMFQKVMKTMMSQIDTLVNIANSFAQFAQMPEPKRSTFQLTEVINEVGELYSHTEEVQLQLHLPEDDFFVHSDRDQLSRVFNNLVKNAIQAMDEEHGKIEIRMKIQNGIANIELEDNGKGIEEEVQSKIFEPNFSTKSSGMGLGLAMVKQIIESEGGRIYFTSKVGEGTTFHIELPETK